MQYKVIGGTLEEVIKQVNESLAQGWRLQGGISCMGAMGNYYFCQAMIRG